ARQAFSFHPALDVSGLRHPARPGPQRREERAGRRRADGDRKRLRSGRQTRGATFRAVCGEPGTLPGDRGNPPPLGARGCQVSKLSELYDRWLVRSQTQCSVGVVRGTGDRGVATGMSRTAVVVEPSGYVNVSVTPTDSPASSSFDRPVMARYGPAAPGARTYGPSGGSDRSILVEPVDLGVVEAEGEAMAGAEAMADGEAESEPLAFRLGEGGAGRRGGRGRGGGSSGGGRRARRPADEHDHTVAVDRARPDEPHRLAAVVEQPQVDRDRRAGRELRRVREHGVAYGDLAVGAV